MGTQHNYNNEDCPGLSPGCCLRRGSPQVRPEVLLRHCLPLQADEGEEPPALRQERGEPAIPTVQEERWQGRRLQRGCRGYRPVRSQQVLLHDPHGATELPRTERLRYRYGTRALRSAELQRPREGSLDQHRRCHPRQGPGILWILLDLRSCRRSGDPLQAEERSAEELRRAGVPGLCLRGKEERMQRWMDERLLRLERQEWRPNCRHQGHALPRK